MAKLKMKLVSIYAPRQQSRDLLQRLQEMSVIDIDTAALDADTSECPEGFCPADTESHIAAYNRNTSSADNALKILDRRFPEKKGIIESLSGPRTVCRGEFYLSKKQVESGISTAGDIIAAEQRISELKAERLRLLTTAEQMKPWEQLDVPLSYSGTRKTAAFIGTVAGVFSAETLMCRMTELNPQLTVYAEVINNGRDCTYVFVTCPRGQSEEAEELLRTLAFARPLQITSKLPSVKLQSKMERAADCEAGIRECLDIMKSAAEKRRELELFADYCRARADAYKTQGETLNTRNTVLIRGYVAEIDIPYLQKTLDSEFTAVIECEDAPEELAPVKLKNNRFSSPAEMITEMYSLPSKTDIDPTPITGFFYYLFFGMMFSDAGYGLILMIATAIGLKKLHPRPGMKKSLQLFFCCGVSTFIWGLIFGSFFGDSIAVISENFFGHRVALPALIDPMNGGAVTLLLLSLALGFVQIIAGLSAKFIVCMKNGDKAAAFFDAGLWITTLSGIAIFAVGMLAFPAIKTVGAVIAIASVVGLILTQGRDKKNPIMRVLSGVISLYDITGYVSDLLSFSRLMALGLTTAAMGAVFNLLGTLAGNGVAGVILLLIIFPVGHGISFGLNVLGAYVHTLRLQYVELFSKFYDGGGREFRSFSLKSKYVDLCADNIKEETT